MSPARWLWLASKHTAAFKRVGASVRSMAIEKVSIRFGTENQNLWPLCVDMEWNIVVIIEHRVPAPRCDRDSKIGEAGWMDSVVRDGAHGGWTDDGYWAKLGFVVCLSIANSSSETFSSLFVALTLNFSRREV